MCQIPISLMGRIGPIRSLWLAQVIPLRADTRRPLLAPKFWLLAPKLFTA